MFHTLIQWFTKWREENKKENLLLEIENLKFAIRYHRAQRELYLAYRAPDEFTRYAGDIASLPEWQIRALEKQHQKLLNRLDKKTRKKLLISGPLPFHDQAPHGA